MEEWLAKKVIKPSCSKYASPVVVVRRKRGAPRVCIDYSVINKKVIRDHFPLPVIDAQIDKLVDARIFSTIDLRNAFHHVDIKEGSQKYTSFVTLTGQYEFMKVPFGFCN